MSAQQIFANNCDASLAQAIAVDATELQIMNQQGIWPVLSGTQFFKITISDINNPETKWEICTCSAFSADTLTITREEEGTTSRVWPAGSAISIRETAGFLNQVSHQLSLDGRSEVILGTDFAANQAFKLINGLAQFVGSQSADCSVSGIILESGNFGDTRPAAMAEGLDYETPVALPTEITLWLGLDGRLTGTTPSLSNGDVWLKKLAQRNSSNRFTFSPDSEIQL